MKNRQKSSKIALIALSVISLCIIVLSSVLFWQKSDRADATATGSTTLTLSSATAIGTDATTQDSYKKLIGTIYKAAGGTAATANYSTTATQLGTKTIDAVTFADYKVSFAGQEWNIMYASKDTSGNIIVTLWLANTNTSYKSMYSNDWAEDNGQYAYPSNMYGTSLVRSYLVGSQYVASAGATTLTNGSANKTWADIVTNFGQSGNTKNYLVAPTNVAWQKTESAVATLSASYNNPNDAYGTPSKGSFSVSASNPKYNYDYTKKTNYAAWQNDKLWLPSITETGDDTNGGIWNASATQKGNTANTYSWLRSGYYYFAYYAYYLNSSGVYYNVSVYNSSAVRPALHLNLNSAAAAAGVGSTSVTVPAIKLVRPVLASAATSTWSGGAYTIVSGLDPAKMTITLSYNNGTATAVTTSVVSGKDAGTYVVKITPKSGYQWATGTANETITLTKTINKSTVTTPTISAGTGATGATISGFNATANFTGSAIHLSLSNYSYITFGTPTNGSTRSNGDFYATNAGTYTVTMTPDKNHVWKEDNSTTQKTITLKINKATVATPTLLKASGADNATINELTATATYTGKGIYIKLSSYSYITFGTPTSGSTFTDKGAFYATDAKTYTVTMTPDSNHVWKEDNSTTQKTITLKINKANQTPNITTLTGTYGSNTTLAGSGQGTLTWSISEQNTTAYPGTANLENGILEPTKAGKIKIKLSAAGNANYNAGEVEKDFTISPKTVTVPTIAKGTNANNATISGLTATTTYTGSVQHITLSTVTDITFGTPTTGATRDNKDFYATETGSYTFTMSLPNTTNYKWSDNKTDVKTVTLTINKANPTITATDQTTTYSGTNQTVATIVGATVNNSEQTVAYDITSVKDVKAYTVTVSVAASTNYNAATKKVTVTVNKASLTVSWNSTSLVYNGAEQKLGYTLTSATVSSLPSDLITYKNNKTAKAVGSYTASLSVATGHAGNYAFATGAETSKTFTITPALLTFTWSGSATYAFEKGVGKGPDITVNGAQGSDKPNYTVSYDNETTKPTAPGSHTATITLSDTNYKFSDGAKTEYTYTITHSDTVSKVTINLNTQSITVSSRDKVDVVKQYITSVTAEYSDGYTENVTNYTLTGDFSTGDSFYATYSGVDSAAVKVTVTVNKDTPTITATDKTTIYNGADQSVAELIGAKVDNDEQTIVYSVENVQDAKTYKIKVSVAATKNYEAAEKEVTVTVSPATLTVTWGSTSLVYNASEQKPGYTLACATVATLPADLVTYSSDKTAKDVGSYTASLEIGEDYEGNYAFATGAETSKTFGITPAQITFVWSGEIDYTFKKGEGKGPDIKVNGAQGKDELSYTVTYDGSTSKPTGVGKHTAKLVLTGTTAANYKFADGATTTYDYTITHKSETVTAVTINLNTQSITVKNTDKIDAVKQYITSVTVEYDDGYTENVTGYTLTGDFSTGESFYATYGGVKSAAVKVTVTKEAQITGIRAELKAGAVIVETHDAAAIKKQLTVKAVYDDQTEREVADYTLMTSDGGAIDKLTAGSHTLKAVYGAYEAEIKLSVDELKITKLDVTLNKGAKVYEGMTESELRELLTVSASYNDGTTAEVSDYELDYVLSEGNCTFNVKYAGAEDQKIEEALEVPVSTVPGGNGTTGGNEPTPAKQGMEPWAIAVIVVVAVVAVAVVAVLVVLIKRKPRLSGNNDGFDDEYRG